MPTAFNHIGLTVADLAVSTAFYKLLGFADGPVTALAVRHRWLAQIVGLPNPRMELTFLQLGPVALELIRYHEPPGAPRTTLARNDAGSAHIAVFVDDIDAEHRRLVAAGVAFVSPPVTITEGEFAGAQAAYAYDPDGNTVELLGQVAPTA